MDKKSKIMYTMIETAIDKGIRDIKDNPSRGVRNLVDLGMHFATGRFQKDLFRFGQQILSNDSSPYYELIYNIVQNTDPQILKHFCINLGYNSWTYGAEKIRKYEQTNGYNIPWTIVFDFFEKTEDMLLDAQISEILDSGESIGIYCGMFFANISKKNLKSLLVILKYHKDSSYFVFLEPSIITDEIADLVVNAGNVVIMLAMDTQDNTDCRNAVDILLENKCLYGIYSMYNDSNVEYVISNTYLGQIEYLNCTFAFLVRQALNETQNKEHLSQFMQTAKSANEYPFYLIDFYEDLAAVGRIISVEDCLITIKGNGSIVVSEQDKLAEGLNIKTVSLQTIFKKIMPKTQYF